MPSGRGHRGTVAVQRGCGPRLRRWPRCEKVVALRPRRLIADGATTLDGARRSFPVCPPLRFLRSQVFTLTGSLLHGGTRDDQALFRLFLRRVLCCDRIRAASRTLAIINTPPKSPRPTSSPLVAGPVSASRLVTGRDAAGGPLPPLSPLIHARSPARGLPGLPRAHTCAADASCGAVAAGADRSCTNDLIAVRAKDRAGRYRSRFCARSRENGLRAEIIRRALQLVPVRVPRFSPFTGGRVPEDPTSREYKWKLLGPR